jgi:hypothetical protein
MARPTTTKKIRLIMWLRNEGFDVNLNLPAIDKEVTCRSGNTLIRFRRKRTPLTTKEYEDIGNQLHIQGHDTEEYEELFLKESLRVRRQIPIGIMEVQYDLKPNGAVIRINTAQGCVFRMCKIPVELVFDSQGNPKDFVDIEYPQEIKTTEE